MSVTYSAAFKTHFYTSYFPEKKSGIGPGLIQEPIKLMIIPFGILPNAQ